ncbi:TP53-binding protein 1-like isoform X2 [Tubulanus polymorphus]|uniref:TP53-binding protein 1-like isoform X2 n=1 Tax=Tubulanus polymorphus TaxID=672921 RepID=UPI003DA274E5
MKAETTPTSCVALKRGKRGGRLNLVKRQKQAAKSAGYFDTTATSTTKPANTSTRKRKIKQPTATSTPSVKKSKRDEDVTTDVIIKQTSLKFDYARSSGMKYFAASTSTAEMATDNSLKSGQLFMGYAFVLTHGKSEKGTEEFDKDLIRKLITTGSGILLEKVDPAMIAAATEVLLISDSYQRTIKYFHCLASSIPPVSHQWILDCCEKNQLLSYKNYLLPAGIDQDECVIEWISKARPLSGLVVFFASADKQLKEAWTAILITAGCEVITMLPKNIVPAEGEAVPEVIATDASCPVSTSQWAEIQDIPLVSIEWAIQCLIQGKRLQYDHPFFEHHNQQ